MPWREALLTRLGPGILSGIRLGDWLRFLVEAHFAVTPSCWPRALSITAQGIQNSIFGAIERWRFGARIDATRVEPPIFVLGHWRSGTTHLHNLLAQDSRFAFPNNYQVSFPHTFLTTEVIASRLMALMLPRQRPMDAVQWTMGSPQEDEFALCSATLLSPCGSWILPARRELHEKYLTFQGVPQREVEKWSRALEAFLKKLTFKHHRPLVLKSPPHTARIKLLLDLFPCARFLHIARHPHAVFQSSRKLFTTVLEWHRLQPPHPETLDDWIFRQYCRLHDAYFAARTLVPRGQLHELRFEDLEKNPLGELERAYSVLGLPDFATARPAIERYVETLVGYRKNELPALEPKYQELLRTRAPRCFEEWGYGG